MTDARYSMEVFPLFTPGDVVALLSPLQELSPGLYLLQSVVEGWAVLRWLIDDEENEQLIVTEQASTLPTGLLALFVSVGLRLSPPDA